MRELGGRKALGVGIFMVQEQAGDHNRGRRERSIKIVMRIITTKKGIKVIVDNAVYNKIGKLKWYINKGYSNRLTVKRNEIPNSDCKYLSHYVLGRRPTIEEGVFFKNGNSFDCRKRNLEFRINTRRKKHSKYFGVSMDIRYRVRVYENGKKKLIGYSRTEKGAAKMYNDYCIKNNRRTKLNIIK